MAGTNVSVFGATGFVGTRLVARAAEAGFAVTGYHRGNWPRRRTELGHVIFAVGLTADFRTRPFETVAAHVDRAAEILASHDVDSFLYLSSTRIYRGAASTHEDAVLQVDPADPDRLYDISKLMGESLCLSRPDDRFRVARLANVYGPGDRSVNFLAAVIDEAIGTGRVGLRQTLQSAKDYVHVEDVCSALLSIARDGRARLYNVASGVNVTHAAVAAMVTATTGAAVEMSDDAIDAAQPAIDVTRLAGEFAWRPQRLVDAFPSLVAARRQVSA